MHKTANVLNKLPKSQHSKAKRALQEIWMAEIRNDADSAFDAFIETYAVKYDKAAACLVKDRATMLAFYDFPAEHWKHLRTTNPIESTVATVRHPRHRLLDQGAQPLLVRRVLDRPEQADGDRLDALPRKPGERRTRRVFVERPLHLAFGVHPLGNLGREPARHVGLERVDMELEGMQLTALAVDQDVRKTLGHQQRGLRGSAGDDGVGRPGRAVDQHVRVPDQVFDGDAHGPRRVGEPGLDAVGAPRGCGRRLADGERTARCGDDDIGEGAAGIDGNSVGHGGAP